MHAARRASVNSESSCLIIGAGAVGLLCAAVARSKGCSRIVICDIDQRRIDFALREGFADAAFAVPRIEANGIEDQLERARELASTVGQLKLRNDTPVGKSSVTFECTGVPSCVQMSIYVRKVSASPVCAIADRTLGYQIGWTRHVGGHGHSKSHTASF